MIFQILRSASLITLFFFFLVAGSLSAVQLPQSQFFFRENRGQWDADIRFRCTNGDRDIAFYKDRIVFGTRRVVDPALPYEGILPHQMRAATYEFLSFQMRFEGASEEVEIFGAGASNARTHYFRNPNGEQPILHVPDHEVLEYRNLYPGIHLRFYIADSLMKYDVLADHSADLNQVRIVWTGLKELKAEGARLLLQTEWFDLREEIPASWQTPAHGGAPVPLRVEYAQINDSTTAFVLPDGAQADAALRVDPMYLDWSTYFYGSITNNSTWIYDTEVDKNDNVYLTGYTYDKFPGKAGIFDTTLNGNADAFLCRMPLSGNTIDYFTYIGGQNTEYGYGLAGTEDGRIFITGITQSRDFPTTTGVLEPSYTGTSYAGFITGVNSDGTSLIYSTYVGTSGLGSWSYAIDVNERGEVFIAPYSYGTFSVTHPLLPAGFVTNNPDCYVIKYNDKGSKIIQSTRFGGDGFEYTTSIFVDRRDNIYLTGYTNSQNLPATGGYLGWGGNFRGLYDGYLFKIDSGFTKWLVSKYLGTPSTDYTTSVTVNDADEIFVTGITNSPGLPNPINTAFAGFNAFAIKMKADGTYPFWTSYVGQSYWSWRQRIAVTVKDELIMTGNTADKNFPVTADAYQKVLKGAYDGFIAKLDPFGYREYATYFGGNSNDYLYAAAARRIGCVTHLVMSGYSASIDFPTVKAWKGSKSSTTAYWSGVVAKWRDTLKVSQINLGQDKYECNSVFEILDAGNKGASYRWNTNDTVRRLVVRKPGTYSVSASYGCGVKGDTVQIFLHYSPRALLRGDTTLCNNDQILLDARNDTIPTVSYRWNTNDSTRTIRKSAPGKFSVTVRTKYCGSVTDSLTLSKLVTPKFDLGSDSTACLPAQVKLDAGNAGNACTYAWNTGDTSQSIVANQGWQYTYKVQVKNLCGTANDSVVVRYDSFPESHLPQDSVFCNKIDEFVGTGGQNLFGKIRWNTGDSSIIIRVKSPGTYWVRQWNACGQSSDTMYYGMIRSPKADLGRDTLLCTVNSWNINTAMQDSASYSWNVDPVNAPSVSVNKSGLVWVKVQNKCGTALDSVNVRFETAPLVSLPKDTLLCNVSSFVVLANTGTNNDTFYWNTGSRTNPLNTTSNGLYWVQVANDCGAARDSILVAFNESPQLSLPADEDFCDAMQRRTLDATSAQGEGNIYVWNTGEGTPVISANNPGTYSVKVNNACGEATDSVRYRVFPSPQPQLPADTSFCGPFNLPLSIAMQPGWTLTWSDGSSAPVYSATQAGNVRVIARSAEGCTGSDDMNIFNSCNTRVFVPTAFTPSVSSGTNDVFKPYVDELERYEFRIFDRWGNMVFETKNPDEGWDGTYRGKALPEGVYAWSLYYYGGYYRGNMKGTVHLLR